MVVGRKIGLPAVSPGCPTRRDSCCRWHRWAVCLRARCMNIIFYIHSRVELSIVSIYCPYSIRAFRLLHLSLQQIESTRWHLKILKRQRITCLIINHGYVCIDGFVRLCTEIGWTVSRKDCADRWMGLKKESSTGKKCKPEMRGKSMCSSLTRHHHS